ncbi:MAG: amidohydrolase [Tepidanaerobacteraceae bacterium]|jgi:predicted amidohydrolase YtcJ|nr:amidohydrolase [Tepidanaerobacteraceae bacterium]
MDLILYNGNIITIDANYPKAEAISITGDRIAFVGKNEEVFDLKVSSTEIIDLKSKTVVPGFNDSHMHLLSYAISLEMADLNAIASIDDLIKNVRIFIEEKNIPEGQWIQGRGWNQERFFEKRMPTRHDLDKISQKHPIVLARTCGHVCAANTMALAECGILESPPSVDGGSIDVEDDGTPTGILRENAMQLIYRLIPPPDKCKIKDMISKAAKDCLRAGLTSIQTDDFGAAKSDFKDILDAYFELERENRLPLRVSEQVLLPEMAKLEDFLKLGLKTRDGGDFFKIGPLKLLTDGSLGARTAALSEPYEDDKKTSGIAIYTQEELNRLVEKAHMNGMQVACHAIGDRAMEMVFEAYGNAIKKYPREDPRFRIIHCQITTKEILDKFKKYNVIADIQPIFVSSDLLIVEERVGKQRAECSYNWKSLLERGVHVAAGSDSPVESFNPLWGIYAAVTRKTLGGIPETGWLPGQKLSVEQAVYLFTMGSAYCTYEENIKGSITPGKLADLVVLSEDIFGMPPDEIKNVQVEKTFVGGKLQYERN